MERLHQRKLAAVLGDLQERDAQGRVNELILAGDWLITVWADHAARELRIMRLERIED